MIIHGVDGLALDTTLPQNNFKVWSQNQLIRGKNETSVRFELTVYHNYCSTTEPNLSWDTEKFDWHNRQNQILINILQSLRQLLLCEMCISGRKEGIRHQLFCGIQTLFIKLLKLLHRIHLALFLGISASQNYPSGTTETFTHTLMLHIFYSVSKSKLRGRSVLESCKHHSHQNVQT